MREIRGWGWSEFSDSRTVLRLCRINYSFTYYIFDPQAGAARPPRGHRSIGAGLGWWRGQHQRSKGVPQVPVNCTTITRVMM
eukprot:753474-Hanusia_phi.AAC.4